MTAEVIKVSGKFDISAEEAAAFLRGREDSLNSLAEPIRPLNDVLTRLADFANEAITPATILLVMIISRRI